MKTNLKIELAEYNKQVAFKGPMAKLWLRATVLAAKCEKEVLWLELECGGHTFWIEEKYTKAVA